MDVRPPASTPSHPVGAPNPAPNRMTDGNAGFLRELASGLRRCRVDREGVLVAISGGADSVALLRGLVAVASDFGLRLAAAHLDHGLRGEESRSDAEWTAELCDRLGVPCEIAHEDLSAFARAAGLGLEAAGRRRRYDFLSAAAERAGCGLVAAAHTADDQGETILHRIIRGTGLAGLRGMPRRRRLSASVELVRPLLEIRRSTVREWLETHGHGFREDSTNRDESYTRNRLRHRLIPLLESEFNPQAVAAILRLGHHAAEAEEALSTLARRLLDQALLDRSTDVCRLDCRVFAPQPSCLIREALRLLWDDLGWPLQAMGAEEWTRLAVLALESGGSATLPGPIQVIRRGELLVISR